MNRWGLGAARLAAYKEVREKGVIAIRLQMTLRTLDVEALADNKHWSDTLAFINSKNNLSAVRKIKLSQSNTTDDNSGSITHEKVHLHEEYRKRKKMIL